MAFHVASHRCAPSDIGEGAVTTYVGAPERPSDYRREGGMHRKPYQLVTIALAALVLCAVTGVAVAAPSGKLKCFSGAPATCSVSQATVTLDTSSGGFAGAYINNSRNISGTPLSGVTFSFQYRCDPSNDTTSCVGGGSPRWSIPIDSNGDGKTDGYAFVDASNCGSTGTVGPDCPVFFNNVRYDNWAAFAAANPTYKIGNSLPFVIVDTTEPGTDLIYNITITKA